MMGLVNQHLESVHVEVLPTPASKSDPLEERKDHDRNIENLKNRPGSSIDERHAGRMPQIANRPGRHGRPECDPATKRHLERHERHDRHWLRHGCHNHHAQYNNDYDSKHHDSNYYHT
jgi:hypothetical protein